MTFQLPAELPVTVDELTGLRDEATAEISAIQARYDADEDLTPEDVSYLNGLLDAVDCLNSQLAEASTDEDEHRSAVDDAISRARAAVAASDEDDGEGGDDGGDAADDVATVDGEVVEGEVVEETPEPVAAGATGKKALSAKKPTSAPGELPRHRHVGDARRSAGAGLGRRAGAPGFGPEEIGSRVGFARMGTALDSVRKGHGVGRLTGKAAGPKMRQEWRG